MNLPQRKSNRIPQYDYSQNGTYFVTVCTRDRKKILSQIEVLESATEYTSQSCLRLLWHGKIAEKYIRRMDAFYDHISVEKSVIMPDHIHLLITIHDCNRYVERDAPSKRTSEIARFIGTFKRFCNREYGDNIWQDRFYDHVVRNQQDYEEIWQYIENNPINWAIKKRGYE